jgi:hypothetical protein
LNQCRKPAGHNKPAILARTRVSLYGLAGIPNLYMSLARTPTHAQQNAALRRLGNRMDKQFAQYFPDQLHIAVQNYVG